MLFNIINTYTLALFRDLWHVRAIAKLAIWTAVMTMGMWDENIFRLQRQLNSIYIQG